MNVFMNFGQSIGYVAVVALFMLLAKKISDEFAPFDADFEIEEKNNNAVAFRRGGLYLGTAIGMFGALSGASTGFFTDISMLMYEGILITCFMLMSRKVSDVLIIPDISNSEAVYKGNTAVGFVEGAGYIATGIIAYASVVGTGGPWWSILVYFALGQVVLYAVTIVYEGITPYTIIEEVRQGNLSAGVILGAMLIAIALILKGAIAGPFTGWSADIASFLVSTAAGILMICLIFNKFIDRFFLPGTDMKTEVERDHNVAAVTVVSAVKLAMALVISAVVL